MNNNPLQLPLFKLGRMVVRLKPQLIDAMGVEALHFIDDNFKMQGFQGATFQEWPLRVAKQKGPKRAILIQTGTLRRSFRQQNGAQGTTISTDVPYAQVHNDGGTIHMPSRGTILNFAGKKGGKLRLAKVRTEAQQRSIKEIRRANVPAYDIKMPQRRFIGNSPVLNNRIQTEIVKILTQAINSAAL